MQVIKAGGCGCQGPRFAGVYGTLDSRGSWLYLCILKNKFDGRPVYPLNSINSAEKIHLTAAYAEGIGQNY